MENLELKNKFDSLVKYNEENTKITVAVAMSGGVDSSVTAYLLKKQGYNIFGVTMKTTDQSIDGDAKKVCDDLGIKHYILDVCEKFKKEVIDYFVSEYENGRTPNPCVVCNKYIKMGELIDFSIEKGADYMATGHYSNIENGLLKIGDDLTKDQVYFLSQAKEEKVKRLMFPLGKLTKAEVRELGKYLGVRVFAKKDSQEICFVEDGKLEEFLFTSTNGKIAKKGNFVDKKGKILGKHMGLGFYTIGQRKGLGISGSSPYYIIGFNKEKNEIILGNNEDLFKESLIATDINLFKYRKLDEISDKTFLAKTRSRDKFHLCKIIILSENEVKIEFLNEKVRAITPGQLLTLYDEEYRVILSGFIKK